MTIPAAWSRGGLGGSGHAGSERKPATYTVLVDVDLIDAFGPWVTHRSIHGWRYTVSYHGRSVWESEYPEHARRMACQLYTDCGDRAEEGRVKATIAKVEDDLRLSGVAPLSRYDRNVRRAVE